MKTDGTQVIVDSGQALTTPECFKRCFLEMQGACNLLTPVQNLFPKRQTSSFFISSFNPYLAQGAFFLLWGSCLFHWAFFLIFFPFPAFILNNKIYYQISGDKHWIEIKIPMKCLYKTAQSLPQAIVRTIFRSHEVHSLLLLTG